MINLIRNRALRIENQYLNPVDRRRAIGLSLMNLTLLVAWLIGSIIFVVLPLLGGQAITLTDVLTIVITPILIGWIQNVIQNGNLRLASWIFMAVITLSAVLLNIERLDGTLIILFALPLVAAALLLNRNETLVVMGVLLASAFLAAFSQSQIDIPYLYNPSTVVATSLPTVIVVLFVSLGIMLAFSGGAEQLAKQTTRSIERLQDVDEFNRQLINIHDENAVLVHLSELISEKLLYAYVQTHLYDAAGQLLTYRRTGMGTRHTVVPANFRDDSAVGQAIRQKSTVLVSLQDPLFRREHLLPSSTYGMLLPLIFENKLIGVLDIQNNLRQSPFNRSEVVLLNLIAGKLTSGLIQARESANFELALQEHNTVNIRLQAQIVDLRQRVEQSTGSGWSEYLHGRGKDAYGFDFQREGTALVSASDLPQELRPALESGETVVQTTRSGQVINVPIMLRGETLGAMAFTLPANQVVTERQLEMGRIVSQRLAVALENARLVEQSQTQALRERKAGEIASLLIAQQEFNSLLNVAAESFNEALGAVYTHIYLEPEALASLKESL